MNETSICNFLTNSSESLFLFALKNNVYSVHCLLFKIKIYNILYRFVIEEMKWFRFFLSLLIYLIWFEISSFLEYFLHLQTQTK